MESPSETSDTHGGRVNLSDFLEPFDPVLDAGDGNFLIRCPAHDDGAPSLLVSQTADDGRLLLYCRAGCQTDDVLKALGLERRDLFSATKRPDPRRPVTTITRDPDGPTIEDTARLAMYAQRCRENLTADTDVARQALAYIEERWGLDADLASRLGVGVDPGGMWWENDDLVFSPVYWNVPRVTIPFRDFDGRTIGLQGRALGESRARWAGPMNPDGRAWSRYAFMTLDTGLDTIVATEGPGDALTVASAGLDAFAIRGAAVVKSERLITELAATLNGRRVVIAGDQDDAGERFTQVLADALVEHGIDVYVIALPDGVNDLTEWRESDPSGFGPAFLDAVDQADAWDSTPMVTVPEPMKNTEVALAAHLRECLRLPSGEDGVIYAGGQGWHLWTGKGWKRDGSAMHIRRSAQEMALLLEAEGHDEFEEAMGDPDLERAARAKIVAGQRAQRSNFLNGLISELKVMVMVDPNELDRHVHLLNCANGVVDLRDGSLSEHDPSLLLTKLVDVNFDPSAECPRWKLFVEECHPNSPEMAQYLQTLSGYSLCGNPLQLVALHHGSGANGKSTWIEALTFVLQGVSVHTPFSTFEMKPAGGIPNDLAMLAGQRIAVASEGEANRPLSEAIIKKISGGDTITARWMRGEFFSFEGRFMTHLLTNHVPSFGSASQSEGLWRRLRLIKWDRFFAPHERDPYLMNRLRDEKEGILRWIVDGAVRFHTEGLDEPHSVKNASRDYRDTSDLLGTFVASHLVPEKGARTSAPAMYAAYRDHMIDVEGVRESEVLSARRFYADIRDRGFGTSRGRIGGQIVMIFSGLRLKTPDEITAEVEADPDSQPAIGVPMLTSSQASDG